MHVAHVAPFRRRYRRSIDILRGSDNFVRHFREPNRFFSSPVHEPRPFTVVVVRRRRSGVAHRISHWVSIIVRSFRRLLSSLEVTASSCVRTRPRVGGCVFRRSPFVFVDDDGWDRASRESVHRCCCCCRSIATVRIVMSRLSSLAVVSIDRSINSRANRMDLRNADLALGRFFPIDLFSLKKKDLRAFSTNNVRTSRNRRLKTTIYTLPEPVAETTFFFVVAEKKRARFLCTKVVSTKPIFSSFGKKHFLSP